MIIDGAGHIVSRPVKRLRAIGIAAVLLAQVCAADDSGALTFGGARIVIPPPPGFKNVVSDPDAHWLTQAYRSPGYDVAAFYVPEGTRIEKVEAGREIERHMVVLRPTQPAPKSYREFRDDEAVRQRIAQQHDLRVIHDAGNSAVTLATRSSPAGDVVVATSSVLVRERLITLHVVTVRRDDAASRWAIDTTMRWIESINAANP